MSRVREDGCGRHDEHVRRFALGGERGALCNAETVLFVRDDRAEPVEHHRFAE